MFFSLVSGMSEFEINLSRSEQKEWSETLEVPDLTELLQIWPHLCQNLTSLDEVNNSPFSSSSTVVLDGPGLFYLSVPSCTSCCWCCSAVDDIQRVTLWYRVEFRDIKKSTYRKIYTIDLRNIEVKLIDTKKGVLWV